MYEAIVVVQYGVCQKTPAGLTPVYNNTDKHVKTIVGFSVEDCKEKVQEFLKENEFKSLTGSKEK